MTALQSMCYASSLESGFPSLEEAEAQGRIREVGAGTAHKGTGLPQTEIGALASEPVVLPAFDELMQRYQRQLLVIAYRILGNWQDAEDLAQEALLKAYLRLGDLANPAALGPWLRRLTVNACLDALARRQRRPSTVSLSAPDEQDAAGPERLLAVASAEDDAIRAEEWRDFQALLLRLEPGAREALLLRELYGYSYVEIAAMLDLGLSAVKMRVHRARHAVQRAMSEQPAA